MSRLAKAVRVTPGFCLLTAWFALACGWRPLTTIITAAAIHELGHCLALKLLGARIAGFQAGVLGCVLEADAGRLSYGGELAAVLAGPGSSLLAALALSWLDSTRWEALIGANLVLGAFNLLPIRPLDGGRALELLISWLAGPAAGEQAAQRAGAAAALALSAGLLAVMERTGGSLWLLPPAAAALSVSLRELWGLWEGRRGIG